MINKSVILCHPNVYSSDDVTKYTFQKGQIIKEYQGDEDHSYHGSPYYSDITEVLLEDGTVIVHDNFLTQDLTITSKETLSKHIKNTQKELRKRIRTLASSSKFIESL